MPYTSGYFDDYTGLELLERYKKNTLDVPYFKIKSIPSSDIVLELESKVLDFEKLKKLLAMFIETHSSDIDKQYLNELKTYLSLFE